MPTELHHEQRSEEWFAARCGRVTASSVSAVLAKIKTGESAERRNYRAKLVVERLTGKPVSDTFINQAMQRGIDLEAEARVAFEAQTGAMAIESGFWIHDDLMAGASPDGLIDDDGLLEIKVPSLATHLTYLQEKRLPPAYEPQVMFQMYITGRAWCDFVSYSPDFPEHLQLFIFRAQRDEEYIAHLESELVKFLAEVDEQVMAFKKAA